MKFQTLNNWTPRRAHKFARSRIEKIKHLLTEIGYFYGDVDGSITYEVDDLINSFGDLEGLLDEALAEERRL